MLKRLKECLSLIGFPRILYHSYSKANGDITVISQFGQNSISVDNLTQTGPIIDGLWKFAVKKVLLRKLQPENILILGVGGGSIIRILRNYFPQARITGIEIDKKMIDIAKKYFYLDKYQASIIIDDAFNFVQKSKIRYDLIIIDLLIGRQTPPELYSLKFYKQLKVIMRKGGLGIVNRLRLKKYDDKNALIFKHLQKLFPKVEYETPLINQLIFFQ